MNHSHATFLNALHACADACDSCLDQCLEENNLEKMVTCIRTDRDCAKICRLTASFIASDSHFASNMVRECEKICNICRDECGKHEANHCQECAEACRQCAEACHDYLNVAA